MNKGDYVMISPDLIAMKGWMKGQIIDVEDNPFNGKGISAQTEGVSIYFGVMNLFNLSHKNVCYYILHSS